MSRLFARLLLMIGLLAALTAICSLPRAFPPPTPTVFPLSENPTETTPAAETPTGGPCGFVWAHKTLPELSGQLFARLKEAGLPVITAGAEAYGEDCLDSDGTPAYFVAMETDYRVTLAVETLAEAEVLGGLLEQTLEIIGAFPVEETPGLNPGYIGIVFETGESAENLWFQQRQADALRAQGLSGAQLYEALKNR